MKKELEPLNPGHINEVTGIKIIVKFYASLREKMGLNRITLKFNGIPSFSQLMSYMDETLSLRPFGLLNDGNKRGTFMISINNKFIHPGDLAKLKLKDKDIIDIMPLPSGG